jgi:cysteinyl-tRNA synthetase
MGLKLFNTLSRSVEEFTASDNQGQGKRVGMYCCGPTVHDSAHIGNFRTFVFADLLRRHLEFRGFEVEHVMNITDVEDKIIARVRTSGVSLREYTSKYEQLFREDLKTLGCLDPHRTPRATDHIPEMIALIERLIARGFAYATGDGSVYFSIEKYQNAGYRYGRLVNLNFEEMRSGERIRSDEYSKESVADFALWKGRVVEDGEVFWPSPWGEGRPGWHIECSAMSMKYLGATIDVHLGGEDLVFPHHEDEIAQSEGAGVQAPGRRFVNYWVHAAHLLVEGKKMSKSLINYFTLRDLLGKGFSGQEIRYLLLTANYRKPLNFTMEGLRGARSALTALNEWFSRLSESAGNEQAPPDGEVIAQVGAALDDDMNVSAAWAAIFTWIHGLNRSMDRQILSAVDAASALAAWDQLQRVFGIRLRRTSRLAIPEKGQVESGNPKGSAEEPVPSEVLSLLERRQAARKERRFQEADLLRDQLKAAGWLIEDTPKGPRLKRI